MICEVQPQTEGGKVFPCRQCMPCRINEARKWQARLILEWFSSVRSTGKPGAFVTLTYAPENLPADGVQVRDAQLFLKRLRKAVGSFRYFLVAEYGEVSGRAHYHALLFGLDPAWLQANLASIWKHGFVHVGTISENSVAYVADYCLKVPKGRSCSLNGRNREFRLMSRKPGIGGHATEDVKRALTSWEGGLDEVDQLGVPRCIRVPRGSDSPPELRPLDRYMREKIEKLMGVGGSWVDHFRFAVVNAYSKPVMTEEEKAARRKVAQAAGLRKHQRLKMKEKL